MRFKGVSKVLSIFTRSKTDVESSFECKTCMLRPVATGANHESAISYEAFLSAIHASNQAFESAVSFLDDLAGREPQQESLAFNIFETLIKDAWQRTRTLAKEESYDTWCPNCQFTIQYFLQILLGNLSSIGLPFSTSVHELARRDTCFRNIFAWINRQSCCNINPYSDLSDDQHFLLNLHLILSPDAQLPIQDQDFPLETTSPCEVCFDQDVKRLPLTRECEHEGGVCLDCLARAIAAQLDCKRWDELTCPLCPAKLDSNTVERYSSEETVQRYQKYMVSDTLKNEPRYRKCLRSTCQMGQIHEAGEAEPLMTCAECGFRMCYMHSRPWHEGLTCSQYDDIENRHQRENQHRMENESSLWLIERVSKRCPGRGCNAPIEKNKGCDHMTCYSCGFEFCWQCLAPYEPIRDHGNESHETTCRYYSKNIT